MRDLLNNPVWHALLTNNSHLANGEGRIRYFDEDVSPFAAMIDNSQESLAELYKIPERGAPVLLWANEELSLSSDWKLIDKIPGYQMVFKDDVAPAFDKSNIVELTKANIPEMIALTKLTKPGPFGTRTIEFGNYEGIFEDGKLAAMTGQRFQPGDQVEISAVCTHPGYTGRGYAKQLLLSQIQQILGAGKKPHLHVRGDNDRAIGVYEQLGFTVNMPVFFYVLRR